MMYDTLLAYRWMQGQDIPALCALAHKVHHAHYANIVSREQIDYMLSVSYTAENLLKQQAAGMNILLAEIRGELAGYLAIRRAEEPSAHFIQWLYVDTARQGQGIGSKLLQEVSARMPEAQKLILRVNRQNHSAIRFYQKQGFMIAREDDRDIGKGFWMRDYVMERKAAPSPA